MSILSPWWGASASVPWQFATSPLASARHAAFLLLDFTRIKLISTLYVLFLFVVLRAVSRRRWVAVALTFLVFGAASVQGFSPPGASIAVELLASAAVASFGLYVLLRWGFFAALVMAVVSSWLQIAPLTLDTSSWYFSHS